MRGRWRWLIRRSNDRSFSAARVASRPASPKALDTSNRRYQKECSMSFMFLLAHAGESAGGFHLELPLLHPILVHFTAALVPASLVSDVLGRLLRRQSL